MQDISHLQEITHFISYLPTLLADHRSSICGDYDDKRGSSPDSYVSVSPTDNYYLGKVSRKYYFDQLIPNESLRFPGFPNKQNNIKSFIYIKYLVTDKVFLSRFSAVSIASGIGQM